MAASFVAPHAASDLLRVGFSAALDSSTRRVDEWHATVDRYGGKYMVLGAAELQDHIARDLILVQQQLDHPQMWAVASRMMTMAGKTSGDAADSVSWYQMAMKSADRSEEQRTRVWVRGRAALALAYEGASLVQAEEFSRQALAISDQASLGRLNALLGLAHVRAHQGRTREALDAWMAARRVFDRVASSEQVSDYAIPEWRMAVISSLLLSRLGLERQAVDQQEDATKTMPSVLPRFATHIELHRGLMLARSGDYAGGIAHASKAMDALPVEKHSQSLRLILAEIENCVPV